MSALPALERPARIDRRARDRGGSLPQGILLSLLAVLPTMGAVLIVPTLPLFEHAFAAVPGIALIAPAVLTLPALCIGIFSAFAGAAADRFGRRRLLLGALLLYAAAGTAPAFLTSISLIVVSRVLVGISEAVIMTCCTTLLGDYFSGSARERWLSYQSAVVAIGATLLFVIGGALGAFGWRTPFFAYAAALPLAAMVFLALPEPRGAASSAADRPFPWKPFRRFIVLAAFAAIAFYAVPVQLGFILGGIGIASPPTIGLLAGFDSLAIAAGAVAFRFVSRFGGNTLVAAAAIVAGCGFLVVAHATSLSPMVIGLAINGLGTGLLLPTLLAMAMEPLPFELRGRGMGIYMGAFFIGQFVSPIVVMLLAKEIGRLPDAIGVVGWVSLSLGIAAAAMLKRNAGVRTRSQP
jgi:MFS family permease